MRTVENYKAERAKDQPGRKKWGNKLIGTLYRLSHSDHVIFKVATRKNNEAYPRINVGMKKSSYPRNLRRPPC